MLDATYLVLDFETIPDGDLLNAVKHQGQKTTEEAISIAIKQAKEASNDKSDFIPLPFHIPVALGIMLLSKESVVSDVLVGSPKSIAKKFWSLYEATTPIIVSYNGRGFDLPLLELVSMREKLVIPKPYWGKYGPRNRFGDGHVDLQEFINNFGSARMFGGLDTIAKMIGLEGKSDVCGSDVYRLHLEGKKDEIREYCLRDVKDTAAIFLRTRVMMGILTQDQEALYLSKF